MDGTEFWWLFWFPAKNNSCQLIWASLCNFEHCTDHFFHITFQNTAHAIKYSVNSDKKISKSYQLSHFVHLVIKKTPVSVNTLRYFDLNARPDIWILNWLYSPSSLSSYTLLFLGCVILWQFSWQCCAIEKTRPINYLVDRTTLGHWNLVFLTTATASFYTSYHLILFLFHYGLD